MESLLNSATKVLGIAGSITTLLALAALSVLGAYLLAAQWLHGKDDAAKAAIDKGDNEVLARLLGGVAVPLDKLTAAQKYALATEELRTRAKQRIFAHALIFFAFLAVLVFAFVLATTSGRSADSGKTVQLDLLAALNVLRYVAENERQELCPTLMSKEDCERAGPMIASLTYRVPTEQQRNTISEVVSRGSITEGEAEQLAACGGTFNFKVVDHMLACADGTPLPVIVTPVARAPLEAEEAIVLHASVTDKATPFTRVASLIANGRPDLPGPLGHLLISRNGAIAQTAAFNQRASHVGRGAAWHGVVVNNSNSIGIELIHTGDYSRDPYPETQLKAAIGVVDALMKAYGITTVVGHSEVALPAGRKTDPGPGVASEIRKAVGLPAE